MDGKVNLSGLGIEATKLFVLLDLYHLNASYCTRAKVHLREMYLAYLCYGYELADELSQCVVGYLAALEINHGERC